MLKRRKNYSHESLPVLPISPWLEKTSQFIFVQTESRFILHTRRRWQRLNGFLLRESRLNDFDGERLRRRTDEVWRSTAALTAVWRKPRGLPSIRSASCRTSTTTTTYWVCWFWFWFLSRFLFYFEAALDFGEKAGSVFCEGADFVWFFVKPKKGRN